jgi:aspartate kinase
MGKVSIVGAGMKTHPGVAAKVFSTLGDEGINIEMISTSPIKISCVIRGDRVPDAVRALHSAFELSGTGTIQAERPFGEFAGWTSSSTGDAAQGAASPSRGDSNG